MSLARAMTRRIKRSDVPSSPPARSQSVRSPSTQIDRSKISLPVALVSTTNMLSYNAPDLPQTAKVASSTASTHSSAEDSDHSASTTRSRASTVGSRDTTLTDASSVNDSPTSPAPNHLSAYFAGGKEVRRSASTNSMHQVKEETVEAAPAIPQRALSHSKRAHERLAAKRSIQNINLRASTGSLRHSREQRSSVDMFSPSIAEEQTHPFGRELEQLNEIVEEFGGVARDAEFEADVNAMRSRNLAAFCAADYLSEIRPLFSNLVGGFPQQAAPMAWI